jgi:hypothetical protein
VPQVAGALALLSEACPGCGSDHLRSALASSTYSAIYAGLLLPPTLRVDQALAYLQSNAPPPVAEPTVAPCAGNGR